VTTDSAQEDRPEPTPERRKVLTWLMASLGAVTAAVLGLPAVAFVLAPRRRSPTEPWQPAGRVSDFPLKATKKVVLGEPESLPWAGLNAREAVYLRRTDEEEFVAFSVYCTHTACPVRWVEGAQLFLCPCHGGAFHADGAVASGPPPSPLPRHETRVRNGRVEVRTLPVLVRGKT
jgi:menaquinol-cytochrome c reductase iron-sulfur subunit